MRYDVCVIGGGPAGISAAIYAARAGMDTAVVTAGDSALETARVIENYYGFEQISGGELYARGLRQAARLGCGIYRAEVISAANDDSFKVTCTDAEIESRALIIATGRRRRPPGVPGLDALMGAGVSSCAVCDGFFFRGKNVGVLGEGAYAMSEAEQLSGVAAAVTVFTGGAEPEPAAPPGIGVDTRRISGVLTENAAGRDKFCGLRFDTGETAPLAGIFLAQGKASAGDLALKLGVITRDGAIITDGGGRTNVSGLFAAGDCTGGLCQISAAVGQGAAAGLSAAAYCKK